MRSVKIQEAFALFRKHRSMKTKVSTIFGIPDVSEQILESVSDDDLIQCLKVSSTWKEPRAPLFLIFRLLKLNDDG